MTTRRAATRDARWGALAFLLLATGAAATVGSIAGRPAGVLLLPYFAWVTFAAALTFAVWRRNPGYRSKWPRQ